MEDYQYYVLIGSIDYIIAHILADKGARGASNVFLALTLFHLGFAVGAIISSFI